MQAFVLVCKICLFKKRVNELGKFWQRRQDGCGGSFAELPGEGR